MSERSLAKLHALGCEAEVAAVLLKGIPLPVATGARSTKVAIEVAQRLCAGDLSATAFFMNRRHPWLGGQRPIERAEESDDDLAFVLEMIGAIEAGVFI